VVTRSICYRYNVFDVTPIQHKTNPWFFLLDWLGTLACLAASGFLRKEVGPARISWPACLLISPDSVGASVP